MTKTILYLLSLLCVTTSLAQFQMGVSIGNSNFRNVMPYTGTIYNNHFSLLAGVDFGYQFKEKPFRLDYDALLFASNHFEESFQTTDSGYKRAYARRYNQQSHIAFLNYIFLQNTKLNAFLGGGLGYFRSTPDIFYIDYSPHYNKVHWDKQVMHRFAYGAKAGLIIGQKRLRTKIELNHFFLSQYDFAGFAQEMNSSIRFGLLWIFMKR